MGGCPACRVSQRSHLGGRGGLAGKGWGDFGGRRRLRPPVGGPGPASRGAPHSELLPQSDCSLLSSPLLLSVPPLLPSLHSPLHPLRPPGRALCSPCLGPSALPEPVPSPSLFCGSWGWGAGCELSWRVKFGVLLRWAAPASPAVCGEARRAEPLPARSFGALSFFFSSSFFFFIVVSDGNGQAEPPLSRVNPFSKAT